MSARSLNDILPLKLPTEADLEEAAQEIEELAKEARGPVCAEYLQAAGTYRLAIELRRMRADVQNLMESFTGKSVFEHVFGKSGR